MTIISKSASVLSIGSALVDIHKTAVRYAHKEEAKTSASIVISSSLSAQRADNFSYKDAARKNWLNEKKFFASSRELWGKIKGYIKGVISTAPRYIPNFALGIIALSTKNKTLAKLSTLGLAIVEIYDFVVNSIGIQQNNSRLKIK